MKWVIVVVKAGLLRELFGPFDSAQEAAKHMGDNFAVSPGTSCTVSAVKPPSELHPDYPGPRQGMSFCHRCDHITQHVLKEGVYRCMVCDTKAGTLTEDYRYCPACLAETKHDTNGICTMCIK